VGQSPACEPAKRRHVAAEQRFERLLVAAAHALQEIERGLVAWFVALCWGRFGHRD
jgi:hypothetical protein